MEDATTVQIQDYDNDEIHRCSWGEFCEANEDMEHEQLTEIKEEMETYGVYSMGGGAAPRLSISIVEML